MTTLITAAKETSCFQVLASPLRCVVPNTRAHEKGRRRCKQKSYGSKIFAVKNGCL